MAGRHQAFFHANKDLTFNNIVIKQGEKIRVEESYKYSAGQRAQLWQEAGLNPFATWGARSATNKYCKLEVPMSSGSSVGASTVST